MAFFGWIRSPFNRSNTAVKYSSNDIAEQSSASAPANTPQTMEGKIEALENGISNATPPTMSNQALELEYENLELSQSLEEAKLAITAAPPEVSPLAPDAALAGSSSPIPFVPIKPEAEPPFGLDFLNSNTEAQHSLSIENWGNNISTDTVATLPDALKPSFPLPSEPPLPDIANPQFMVPPDTLATASENIAQTASEAGQSAVEAASTSGIVENVAENLKESGQKLADHASKASGDPNLKNALITGAAIATLAAGGYMAYRSWNEGQKEKSTNRHKTNESPELQVDSRQYMQRVNNAKTLGIVKE